MRLKSARLLLQDREELTLRWLSTLLVNLGGTQLQVRVGLSVRVQSQHNLLVLQWVLLQDVRSLGRSLVGWSDNSLDLRRVDQGLVVGVRDNVGWQRVASLVVVDRVQRLNGSLGPDNESTQVSTWSQLQQTQTGNVGSVDTWNVSQGLGNTVVVSVDNQWTLLLDESSASQLTLTSSQLLGLDDSDDVLVGTNSLQSGNSLLGLGDGLELVSENQWQLLDLLDSVASGQNQRGDSRSGNSRSSSVTLLVLVHLDVPSSPSLGWSEHTTTSTHVTESTLAGSVSTGTTNSWDSGNSTTGTPRLSRSLVTSLLRNSVSLSLVLVHSGENGVDNVGSDWSSENSWQRQLGGGLLALGRDNRNLRTRHVERK